MRAERGTDDQFFRAEDQVADARLVLGTVELLGLEDPVRLARVYRRPSAHASDDENGDAQTRPERVSKAFATSVSNRIFCLLVPLCSFSSCCFGSNGSGIFGGPPLRTLQAAARDWSLFSSSKKDGSATASFALAPKSAPATKTSATGSTRQGAKRSVRMEKKSWRAKRPQKMAV